MRTAFAQLKTLLSSSDSIISRVQVVTAVARKQTWIAEFLCLRQVALSFALVHLALGCSRPYACEERGQGASAECSCVQSRASSAKCNRTYDCCAEFSRGGILADDPNSGYGCYCWMLGPGQTCENSSQFLRQGTSYHLDSRPKTCPP